MFTSSDLLNQPFTQYRIENLLGSGSIDLNGAVNLANGDDRRNSVYVVSAADFAKVRYVAGMTREAEGFQISAFDGTYWGGCRINVSTNHSPVVTGKAAAIRVNDEVALSSLISTSDKDGDVIDCFVVNDPGHLLHLHGASNFYDWCHNDSYGFSAADLAKVTVSSATKGNYLLSVTVSDGMDWSNWSSVSVEVKGKQPPALSGSAPLTIKKGESIAAASLFSVSSPGDDGIAQYQFTDPAGFGSIKLNGASNLASLDEQAAGIVRIAASDLGLLTYIGSVAAAGTEAITVAAFGGTSWSGAVNVFVGNEGNKLPTVTLNGTGAVTVTKGQAVGLASLFSVSDPDSDIITQYQFSDTASLGSIKLNGATNLASTTEQTAGIVRIAAADLPLISYIGGEAAGAESIAVTAFDGTGWSTARTIAFTNSGNRAPLVANTVSNPLGGTTVKAGEKVHLSGLISISDPDSGDSIRSIRFSDPSGLGRIVVAAGAAFTVDDQGRTVVAAADLDAVSYQGFRLRSSGGPTSEMVKVSAFDGTDWSAPASLLFVNSAEIGDITALTLDEFSHLDASQLQTLSGDQIRTLDATHLKALSPQQVALLVTSQVQAMTAGQVGQLTIPQLAALTVAQVQALSTDQLLPLASEQLRALNADALTEAQVKGFTQSQLKVLATLLPVRQTAFLGRGQIGSLTSTQLASMRLDAFSTDQLQAIAADQLTPGVLTNLSIPQFQALSAGQISTLSNAALLIRKASNLSIDQVRALGGGQLTAGVMAQLTAAQVAALGNDKLSGLSVDALKSVNVSFLTLDQIGALNTDQLGLVLSSLNGNQIRGLSNSQIASLGYKVSMIGVGSLTTDQISSISLDAISLVVGSLSGAQQSMLTGGQLQVLTTTQVSGLSLKSLSGDQLQAFSATQIKGLNVSGLSTDQFLSLSGDQLQNLTSAQIASLSGKELALLDPNSLAHL
ncbi:MAG: hypothetical protein WCJ64_17780 [Rhodospirillaceae bacterium]